MATLGQNWRTSHQVQFSSQQAQSEDQSALDHMYNQKAQLQHQMLPFHGCILIENGAPFLHSVTVRRVKAEHTVGIVIGQNNDGGSGVVCYQQVTCGTVTQPPTEYVIISAAQSMLSFQWHRVRYCVKGTENVAMTQSMLLYQLHRLCYHFNGTEYVIVSRAQSMWQ